MEIFVFICGFYSSQTFYVAAFAFRGKEDERDKVQA
jgi:hypothetical protein